MRCGTGSSILNTLSSYYNPIQCIHYIHMYRVLYADCSVRLMLIRLNSLWLLYCTYNITSAFASWHLAGVEKLTPHPSPHPTHSCWLLLASRIKGTQNFLTPRIIPLCQNSFKSLFHLHFLSTSSLIMSSIHTTHTHKGLYSDVEKLLPYFAYTTFIYPIHVTIQNSTTPTTIHDHIINILYTTLISLLFVYT